MNADGILEASETDPARQVSRGLDAPRVASAMLCALGLLYGTLLVLA